MIAYKILEYILKVLGAMLLMLFLCCVDFGWTWTGLFTWLAMLPAGVLFLLFGRACGMEYDEIKEHNR